MSFFKRNNRNQEEQNPELKKLQREIEDSGLLDEVYEFAVNE